MPTASPKPTKPLVLLGQWLLFTSFAVWAGLMLADWLTPWLASTLAGSPDGMLVYVVLFVLGLSLGIVQALVLGRLLPEAGRWRKYTLAGFVGAMLVMALAGLFKLGSAAGLVDDALLLLALGAVIGLGQWALLRQIYPQAWLWILATALGALAFLFLLAKPATLPYEFAVRGTLYGLIAALPTGLVLAWFNRPEKA